jgi:serine/threonine protein kinase
MQVGTTFLMAPEVQRGNGCYGRKVDSFSLGATLVELGIATFLTSKFSSSRDEMLLLLKQQRPEIGMAFQNLVRDLTAFSERRRSDAATALQTFDALF